jgi:hypothetical protein
MEIREDPLTFKLVVAKGKEQDGAALDKDKDKGRGPLFKGKDEGKELLFKGGILAKGKGKGPAGKAKGTLVKGKGKGAWAIEKGKVPWAKGKGKGKGVLSKGKDKGKGMGPMAKSQDRELLAKGKREELDPNMQEPRSLPRLVGLDCFTPRIFKGRSRPIRLLPHLPRLVHSECFLWMNSLIRGMMNTPPLSLIVGESMRRIIERIATKAMLERCQSSTTTTVQE